MDIQSNGDFLLRIISPDDSVESTTGMTAVNTEDNEKLLITLADGSTRSGEAFLEDDQVAYQIDGGATWDFNDNGIRTAAKLSLIMDR